MEGRMMKNFVKVENGVVVQIQPNDQKGFIEAPADVSIGHKYDGKKFSPPAPVPAGLNKIRARRDQLLKACDWTQLPDSPLSQEKKTEWAEYRQTLRDLPLSGPAEKIKFPETPA